MKVAATIAVVLLLSLPLTVVAHAELVSSDPPAGGSLTTTPFPLTATFDDELSAESSLIVVGPEGDQAVASGTVSDSDVHSMKALLPKLADGTYTVRWTAVSLDDGAVERGTYRFSVASGSATPGPTAPPSDSATGSSVDVLIALGIAAVFIAVVAVVFVRTRR